MSYKVDPRETTAFQQPVEDKDIATPPAFSKGKRYIIPAVGTSGDWIGKEKYIVDDTGADWNYISPKEGMIIYVKDEQVYYKYENSTWTLLLEAMTAAINVSTDTTNFNGNLSSADTDVQKALDTLDTKIVYSRSFVITNPTSSADLPLWRVPNAITITAVHLLCFGAAIVGNLWEYDSNGLNGSAVDADITGVLNTNVNDDGALSNPSIASGNYLGWKSASATVGATYAIVSFDFTIDNI